MKLLSLIVTLSRAQDPFRRSSSSLLLSLSPVSSFLKFPCTQCTFLCSSPSLPLSLFLASRAFMYGRWRSASIARGEKDEMTSLFRLSDSFHSEPEWMDYWSKFWDCGDVAVGRYQHAHAASTYSYTLALSRSPSPLLPPISFCNLLTLSSFHRPTRVSPFLSLRSLDCPSLPLSLCLSTLHLFLSFP